VDMDDDFIGEIEFELSPEQGELVSRAIDVAVKSKGNELADEFVAINPLIAIMRWWETHVPENERPTGSPETKLVEACRRFLLAHGSEQPSDESMSRESDGSSKQRA
jgi:hypothetical protein